MFDRTVRFHVVKESPVKIDKSSVYRAQQEFLEAGRKYADSRLGVKSDIAVVALLNAAVKMRTEEQGRCE